MGTVAQLFNSSSLLTAVRGMRTHMEVAMRVAELGSADDRRRDAEMIVGLVMRSEITVAAFQKIGPGLVRAPLPPCIAASLMFMSARLLIDQNTDGSAHLRAKLEVNKMEKRLIAFVGSTGMRAWPHSCEFIVGPYASPAQFAQVQARYVAANPGASAPAVDTDPTGFAGA